MANHASRARRSSMTAGATSSCLMGRKDHDLGRICGYRPGRPARRLTPQRKVYRVAMPINYGVITGGPTADTVTDPQKLFQALPAKAAKYAYLRDVLQKMIDGHPINRLDELLPWAWKPEKHVNP